MRVLKGIIKSILALFLALLIFWAAILGFLQTEKGQQWSLNTIKGYVERHTNIRFEVGSVHFSFPLDLELTDISFYKGVGEGLSQKEEIPLATIHRLELSCAYTHLLNGRVVFSKLHASDIDIFHFPEPSGAHLSSDERPWDAPLFPFYIKFSNIDVQNIRLGPEAVDSLALREDLKPILEAASFDLKGMLSNNPFRHSLTAHLQLKAKSSNPQYPPLNFGIDAQNHQLSLSMHFSQIPFQLLLTDFPKEIMGNLALFATAQIVDWQNLFQKHDPSGNFVEGHFKLSLESQEKGPSFIAQLIDPSTTLRSRFLLKPSGDIEMLDLKAENPSFLVEGGTLLHLGESKGSLDFSIQHQNVPWHLASAFDWKDPSAFIFSNLSLEGMDAAVTGYAVCSLPEYIWEGRLEAEIKQLEKISQFLPSPAKGEGQLTLFLSRAWDENRQVQQKIEAICQGTNLSWQDYQARQLHLKLSLDSLQKEENFLNAQALLDGEGIQWKNVAVEQLTLNTFQRVDPEALAIKQMKGKWTARAIQWEGASISLAEGEAAFDNPLGKLEGSIQFALQNMNASAIHFSELTGTADLHSEASSSSFRLKGMGSKNDDLIFSAEGGWSFHDDKFNLLVKNLTGLYGPYPLALLQPVRLLMQQDEMQLSGLHLQWGEGEIQADFDRTGKTISARFETNAVPSELFYFVAPDLALTGRASFQGYLQGSIDQPKGQLQVDLHNVQIVEEIFAQYPFLAGKLLMELDGEGIHLQSELTGIGRTPLLVSGSLPVQFSLNPYQLDVSQSLPFNLLVNAEGDLDPYLHLFIHDSTNLAGHAKIALSIGGKLQSPEVKGSIDLTEGSYESLNTGAFYHHIQAHLEGDGSKILLTEFSARDNKNGSLTATGTIALDPGKDFPFEFQIQPSRISFLDSDYASISASGPLSLSGNSKGSKLQGELTVDQATIRLEEALPKQIKSIDIKYINLPENGDLLPIGAIGKDPGSTMALDIALKAKENVLIQGNSFKV